MSSTINVNYMTRTYSNFLKGYEAKNGSQTKTVSFSDRVAEKSTESQKVSETGKSGSVSTKDMTMEEYKQYIHDKISQIPMHPSRMQESISVNISEAGFEAMKNDPEYEAWVLNDLRTGWAQPDRWAGVCGGAYSTIYYGATKEECHAEMWSAGYQNGSGKSLFDGEAKDSFWERRVEQKKRIEEQVKEQQEKKRIQEEAYEKVAMEKSDAHKRLMPQWEKEAVYSDSVLSKSASAGNVSTANAAYETNFLEKAAESKGTQTNLSAWAGDMLIPQPPSYFGFTYDSSISNKSKEEMTMDEYKQWFMNEMSGMPVSGWYRSTCVGGALTITEECFERMKSDPEWEKTVLGMVRNMYSSSGLMGSKMIGYQVIGATPEQCHGEGIPIKNGSPFSTDNGESWWEKRHERMEELLEEQEKEAVKKAQARRAKIQAEYLKSQMASRQRLQSFLADGIQTGQDGTDMTAFQSAAATAYETNISTFSKSIIGS